MARETIDQLARRLAESLPQSMKALREDMEQNFRSVLDTGLEQLDLVTREEFEVQEAVLARTRAKLEALEVRLAEFEAQAAKGDASAEAQAVAKKKSGRTSSKKAAKGRKRPATPDDG